MISPPVLRDSGPVPVSVLVRAIGSMLEDNFTLMWIAGEISSLTKAASGHWYFSLKDRSAQIRCVMFRSRVQSLDFVPREGDCIEVYARVTLYELRGELQLSVEAMRHAGQGQLFEAFLRLKAQLEAEGLFDTARKRALPAHPRAIGVITSRHAAALRDVLATLARRAPHVHVIVYPAPVQGAGAAEQLIHALQCAQQHAQADMLILCRGGGSMEDLQSFNDEQLARAMATSCLPIVSGIGHETDFTIADFVADVRAPTPTGAAELASPPRAGLLRELSHHYAHLGKNLSRLLGRRMQYLDELARRMVSPRARLAQRREHLQQCITRLHRAIGYIVRHAHAKLDALSSSVMLLSPQRTFERGYAALLDPHSGQALRAPSELRAGKRLTVYLAKGHTAISIADVQ